MQFSLSDIKEFANFLIEAYGAVSSILVFFIVYLAWQLRKEQRESSYTRERAARIIAELVELQVQQTKALVEIRRALKALRS